MNSCLAINFSKKKERKKKKKKKKKALAIKSSIVH